MDIREELEKMLGVEKPVDGVMQEMKRDFRKIEAKYRCGAGGELEQLCCSRYTPGPKTGCGFLSGESECRALGVA